MHPEFVLSAGHCESALLVSDEVQIGQLCKNQIDNCGQRRETRKVKSIVLHPFYDTVFRTVPSYDYMLLHLEKPSSIDPVQYDDGSFSSQYGSRKSLKTFGFGYTIYDDNEPSVASNHLMETSLNYVTQSECRHDFEDDLITSSMMCAYADGTDACKGDSGGQLYDKEANVVVGIVSWGYGCAQKVPGVYSRISYEYEWIRQTICLNSVPDLLKTGILFRIAHIDADNKSSADCDTLNL